MKLSFFIEELPERDVRSCEVPLFRVRVANEKGTSGGFLNVVEEHVGHITDCLPNFFAVSRGAKWKPSTQYVGRVQNVYLSSNLRGKGVGSQLYLAAAEQCKLLGLLLIADDCVGGETSLDARRIYYSKWLKRRALISGLVLGAR